MNDELYEKTFTKPIIKYGRFINLFAIFLCFLPSIVVWVVYGTKPSTHDILTGWGLIASIYGIYSVVEPISYFPILGLPGTYMAFLSGNIGNIRVPTSAVTQEALGVEPGTKKAEIVSTLGIAGSIVTNLIIVTIAAFGGSALMNLFPKKILEAFAYVSPAIFGAIFGMFGVKNLRYAAFALLVAMTLLNIGKIPVYIMIPGCVFGTVAFGFLTYRKKLIRTKKVIL